MTIKNPNEGLDKARFDKVLEKRRELEERRKHQSASVERWRLVAENFYVQQVKECQTREDLQLVIMPAIRDDRDLKQFSREIVTKAVNKKFAELINDRVPISMTRKALKPNMVSTETDLGPAPDWLAPWVLVQDRESFFHIQKKTCLSTKAFDLTYSRFTIDLTGEYSGMTPTKAATQLWPCKVATQAIYWPEEDEGYFRFPYTGEPVLNLYDPTSVPPIPETLFYEHREAQEAVRDHFDWLIPVLKERLIFMDWCAYQVQYPGRKVRWAPLICGIPGDGKTILAEILQAAMGYRNVQVVGNTTLTGSIFTDWGHGYALNVLEEINTPGHNRHEIVNKLKAFVTNSTIEIHPKGRRAFNVPNTTNYLLLTNFEDALPMEDIDRRYFAMRTSFRLKDELERAKRKDPQHFDRLRLAKEHYPGAIRKFFLEYPISDAFRTDVLPMETQHKSTMIAFSRTEEDDLLEDLIQDGDVMGINYYVVSVKEFSKALEKAGLKYMTRSVARILTKAGYINLATLDPKRPDNRVRIEGEWHRLWVRPKEALKQEDVREWARALIAGQSESFPLYPPEPEEVLDNNCWEIFDENCWEVYRKIEPFKGQF